MNFWQFANDSPLVICFSIYCICWVLGEWAKSFRSRDSASAGKGEGN